MNIKLYFLCVAFYLIGIYSTFAYDFGYEGVRYSIIDENEVEVSGIEDEINPERQTPDCFWIGYTEWLGNEIFNINEIYPQFKIEPACLTIPSTVEHEGKVYVVTTLGSDAFSTCNFTHLNLPPTINRIKRGAFMFSGIYHISGIENVRTIETMSFAYCFMDSVAIPESVDLIPEDCFAYSWIKDLTIPGNPQMQNDAFYYTQICKISCWSDAPRVIDSGSVFCFPLAMLSPPHEFRYWGPLRFATLSIPPGTYETYIAAGYDKFLDKNIFERTSPGIDLRVNTNDKVYHNISLTAISKDINNFQIVHTVTFPNDNGNGEHDIVIPSEFDVDGVSGEITKIGRFGMCASSYNVVEFPSNLDEIKSYAFRDSKFNKIIGLERVRKLGKEVFRNVVAREIIYPTDINEVCENTFLGAKVDKIIFHHNVDKIATSAICALHLDTLICYNIVPPLLNEDRILKIDYSDNLHYLFVPLGSIELYENCTNGFFERFENILPIEDQSGNEMTDANRLADFVIVDRVVSATSDGHSLYIYRIDGQCVDCLHCGESVALPAGIYIVRCGDSVQKIAIR